MEIEFGGAGTFGADDTAHASEGEIVVFEDDGDRVAFAAPDDAEQSMDLLLIAGVPLREPVVRYGPFVMSTKQEILDAVRDFESGRMGRIEADVTS